MHLALGALRRRRVLHDPDELRHREFERRATEVRLERRHLLPHEALPGSCRGDEATCDQIFGVAEVFEVPLDYVLEPANYRSVRRRVREHEIDVTELPYGEHRIWGATAAILTSLYQLMRGGLT